MLKNYIYFAVHLKVTEAIHYLKSNFIAAVNFNLLPEFRGNQVNRIIKVNNK